MSEKLSDEVKEVLSQVIAFHEAEAVALEESAAEVEKVERHLGERVQPKDRERLAFDKGAIAGRREVLEGLAAMLVMYDVDPGDIIEQ